MFKLRIDIIDYDHYARLTVSKRLWEREHDVTIRAMSYYYGKDGRKVDMLAQVEQMVFELEFPDAATATLFKLSML